MDFSAFYTAGEALSRGLSPYENHYAEKPPLWDGVNSYEHSRFLYPPLVASFFQVFAMLPYHAAKYAWTVLILVGIGCSLFLAARLYRLPLRSNAGLLMILGALSYHPLLTLIERGQIDALTLLLLTGAFYMMSMRRGSAAAGALIAIATLFKLHTALLIPFLIIRKKWHVLGGYAAGGLLLLALSLAINGYSGVSRYLFSEFPRIAEHGEYGPEDWLVDQAELEPLRVERTVVIKDGNTYPWARFEFVLNASLVRTPIGSVTGRLLSGLGLPDSHSAVSLSLFGCFFVLIMVIHAPVERALSSSAENEFLYWQLVLVVVLLAAPMTWTMNTVWVLPLLPLLSRALLAREGTDRTAGLVLILLGLAALAIPDQHSFSGLFPIYKLERIGDLKYVIGCSVVLTGIAVHLRTVAARAVRSQIAVPARTVSHEAET
jgi:uncharacterized membrane protein